MRVGLMIRLILGLLIAPLACAAEPKDVAGAGSITIDERSWSPQAPRPEVQPVFGSTAPDTLTLEAKIDGADGWWQSDVPIEGGKTYHITIERALENVSAPHRSAVVRIDWLDAENRRVPSARPFVKGILEGYNDMQQPDYLDEPGDQATTKLDWHTLKGTFLSPPTAVKARLELHLR